MARTILRVIKDWTGDEPVTCPWRAFFDPLVRRVMDSYWAFESGNLAVALPAPSHRTVAGVLHLHRVMQRISAEQMKQEREQAAQKRAQGR